MGGMGDFRMTDPVWYRDTTPGSSDLIPKKYPRLDGTYVHFVTYGVACSKGERELNQNIPVVLVIEDEEPIQVLVEDALVEAGFSPAVVRSGEEALTLLQGRAPGISCTGDRHRSTRQN